MIGSPQELHRKLRRWYSRNRRDLPWRVPVGSHADTLPDAYFVLVSEAMLQQTQVATVVPYFKRFIKAFPTIRHLAHADEQAVLRLWQGLGYYSRARNLRGAARMVLEEFGGIIPRDIVSLRRLPGVGRYTAGAIASLAFGRREPIVDGNIVRVICRLDCIENDPRDRAVIDHIWSRAAELLPTTRVAAFNSSLMELGATICTPKQPKCLLCPVRDLCGALAAGKVQHIPPPRKSKPTPLNRRTVICALRQHQKTIEVLIEQRPATGRWAGMWQFITVSSEVEITPPPCAQGGGRGEGRARKPAPRNEPSPRPPPGVPGGGDRALERQTGALTDIRHIAQLQHQLTHRRYEFDVYAATVDCSMKPMKPIEKLAGNRRWVALANLSDYPLPRPHVLIAQALAEQVAHLPPFA